MRKGIIVYLISLLFITTIVHAQSVSERRSMLISIIDQEMSEVNRLLKRKSDPQLMLRLAELMMEKARHLRDIENDNYLKIAASKRSKISKRNFFSRSSKYFSRADAISHAIVKKYRRFPRKAEVYYVLAFNAKEASRNSKALEYFKKARRYSKKGSLVELRSKIALAEMYFNQNKYKDARKFYASAINQVNDKWWTKDALNYAWSLFKTGYKSKAINLLNEVIRKSSMSKYVDVSRTASRDLGYFYVETGRVDDAVSFYKSRGEDFVTNLIIVSDYLIGKSNYKGSERILKIALRYGKGAELAKVYIGLLSYYEKYGKHDKHLKMSKKAFPVVKAGHFPRDQYDAYLYQLKRVSGVLQKHVTSKRYKGVPKTRVRKAKLAVEYFKLLAEIEFDKAYLHDFAAAESLFSVSHYNNAVVFYFKAYNEAKNKNEKIEKLSFDGLMAALGKKGITKKTKDKYLSFAYLNYLDRYPKGKKSPRIYQRAFSMFLEANDIDNAEKMLITFHQQMHEYWVPQEAMLAKIMSYHRTKGNTQKLLSWAKRISSKYFRVSPKYYNKVKKLVLTIKFGNVENLANRGDKKEALVGYLELYRDPDSSKDVKKHAAYNIATIFHELADTKRTYLWANRSMQLMSSREIFKFEPTYHAIGNGLFTKRRVLEAAKIFDRTLKNICTFKHKDKGFLLQNAIVSYIAEDKVEDAEALLRRSRSCHIPKKDFELASWEVLEHYLERGDYVGLKRMLQYTKGYTSIYSKLISPWYVVYKKERKSRRSIKKHIMKLYKKSSRGSFNLKSADVISHFLYQDVDRVLKPLKRLVLRYPERKFQTVLQKKLGILDQAYKISNEVLKTKSGRGLLRVYNRLRNEYMLVVNEIDNFTPKGKTPAYVKAFKDNVRKVSDSLRVKSNELFIASKNFVVRDGVLSKENFNFLNVHVPGVNLNFGDDMPLYLMERGGGK